MEARTLLVCLTAGPLACTGVSNLVAVTGDADDAGPSEENPTGEPLGNDDDDGDSGAGGYDPAFDVAAPEIEPDYDDPLLPETCEDAAGSPGSIGCRFYPVDLDQTTIAQQAQFAVVAANVQDATTAVVRVEQRIAGTWVDVADIATIAPGDTHVFRLSDLHFEGTGIMPGGAFRMTSDVPISAYQFSPLVGGMTFSSGASLLYPITAWATENDVVGWVTHEEIAKAAYLTTVAAFDGSLVNIMPSRPYVPGNDVPVAFPGDQVKIGLDEGGIVQLAATTSVGGESEPGLTGTILESEAGRSVGLFSAHVCASIPATDSACSHIQEQIAPDHFGRRFVATRAPIRNGVRPEPTLWQIYARWDDTEVVLSGTPDTKGLPAGTVVLDRGEMIQAYVTGPATVDGHFMVDADKPVAVTGYVSDDPTSIVRPEVGGPAAYQLAPVDRFLPRYLVYAPEGWSQTYAVITRRAGQTVDIDGVPVPDSRFRAVSPRWEVGHVVLDAGTHTFDGSRAFGLVVLGYAPYDAYAFMGGSGTPVLDLEPSG